MILNLKVNNVYYSIVKGYDVSNSVSCFLKKNNGNKMSCLAICTTNPRCTLVYIDLVQKVCKFYKIVSIDKYLVKAQSDSSNFEIYRRKFKTYFNQILLISSFN